MLGKGFGAPWVLDVGDGEKITFPLLKMRQMAVLQSQLRAVRMAAAKQHMDPKLKPVDATQFLTSVESSTIDIVDLRTWVQTPEGCEVALRLSLGEKVEEILDMVPIDDQLVAALRVTGWVPESPAPKDEKKTSANP